MTADRTAPTPAPVAVPEVADVIASAIMVSGTVRVQVVNVGTVTGFMRRESAEFLGQRIADALALHAPREDARPEPECRHGEPEARCASCAACAACDGGCGVCPYAARPEPVTAPLQALAGSVLHGYDLDRWITHADLATKVRALAYDVLRLVPADDEDTVRVRVDRLRRDYQAAGSDIGRFAVLDRFLVDMEVL